MPYNHLSEPIRRYIRDKRWEKLRPIQAAAINRIIDSDDHFILASRTASGKTEAAFLPILSKTDFHEPGIQVLYISPLIALINDQFNRVEELCGYLDVSVTKWHGEANKSQKEKALKNPGGIMLITPESLEAMFVHRPYNIRKLFSNLKYVVIDEIHSFIGSDRGTQLKSILSRLQEINNSRFCVIGLSATIGDYNEAKQFTGDPEHTKVLIDKTAKEIHSDFRYFKNDAVELPLELLKDLYIESRQSKMLIFPNSRGRTEEIAVKLKKISERVGGHPYYFSHHSSVDRNVREYIEYFAKNNQHNFFAITCTSTLELGIDIGSVDKVAQIDATNSVASLIQRVGRSGRKEGASSNLLLYATDPWELLQSIACWELYKEGIIDPPEVVVKPYDIFIHQLLSIVKGRSGIEEPVLVDELLMNNAFRHITNQEMEEIISYLIKADMLERAGGELIIGLEGELVVNSREFYTVFKSEDGFKVVCEGNTIGEVPFSPLIMEGENLFLAAKIWKISTVDLKSQKIIVMPAKDGKRPIFFGTGAPVHPVIREKMLQLLLQTHDIDYLDEAAMDELRKLRASFAGFKLTHRHQRPLLIHDNRCELYTFTGTKINRALSCLLTLSGIQNAIGETSSEIDIEELPSVVKHCWKNLPSLRSEVDHYLVNLLQEKPNLINFSKWGYLLPQKYQIDLLKNRYYDFNGAFEYIEQTSLVSMTPENKKG
ncbi:MAG: DEAD/DEAH box helicase [Bacteroidales bacterium]